MLDLEFCVFSAFMFVCTKTKETSKSFCTTSEHEYVAV